MSKNIGILCIHGIGYKARQKFSSKLIERISLLGKGVYNVKHRELLWGNALDRFQDECLESFTCSPYKSLKLLLGRTIADAIAYQPIKSKTSLYTTVHNGLAVVLQDFVDCDVIVLVGHSLGSIILSNFLWDIQKSGEYPEVSDLLKNKQIIVGFLGSPYSYYSFRTGKSFYPIESPNSQLELLNFYNPKDIVSAPISDLSFHDQFYIKDYIVRNLPWRNMFINAHLNYWNNANIAKILHAYIQGALTKADKTGEETL